MSRTFAMLTAASIAAANLAGIAAAAPPPKVLAGLVGSAPSSVAGCPYVAWRLAVHPDGKVTGLAYYADLSGVSSVTGNMNAAGKFQLQLVSEMGNGPTGTVTGHKRSDGAGDATLKGPGCANMHLIMKPVSNIEAYHTA